MWVLGDVSWTPNPSALPGFGTLQGITNAVGAYALLGCLVAIIGGGVAWAAGSSSANAQVAAMGKKTVAGAIVGALIIGASSILINFFYHTGQTLH